MHKNNNNNNNKNLQPLCVCVCVCVCVLFVCAFYQCRAGYTIINIVYFVMVVKFACFSISDNLKLLNLMDYILPSHQHKSSNKEIDWPAPTKRAEGPAAMMEWDRGLERRLKLISATATPSFCAPE